MSLDRHIRKLNRLLLAELGENPLYRWIYSESPDFMRAMRLMDDEGKLLFDYRCPCGLNVAVHSASCSPPADQADEDGLVPWYPAPATSLIVAEPKWEIRKTDPGLNDQWVLCCLQIPMSEHEWQEMFGARLPYPSNGTWAPVATETRTVAMPPGTLPGENFTMACIRGRQRSREIKMCDIANAHYSREERKDEDRKKHIRERLTDVLPVNPNPGTRGGSVLVFSEPATAKTGESLVTL